jgi:hypothetical protein|tara:strand:- start:480 stop:773 length:294 start_codon:yes stop_codon:yes gene_type:complete
MEVFARNSRGRWEAIAGSHDDLVFAWMIAIQMVTWADVVDDFRDDGFLEPLSYEDEFDVNEFTQGRLNDGEPPKDNQERLDRMLLRKQETVTSEGLI